MDTRFTDTDVIECSFLVPVTDAWMVNRLTLVKKMLLESFSGYSIDSGVVEGSWIDEQGRLIEDTCRRFIVASSSRKLTTLREIVRRVCREFNQQCVYFVVAGKVEFVGENT